MRARFLPRPRSGSTVGGLSALLLLGLVTGLTGCTTTGSSDTARTATEQLLVSNSIDQALNKVDFSPFAGQNVFLDDQYTDCVDKKYLVSSVRHRLFNSGATVVADKAKADLIVELRAGAVGTDRVETFLGLPEIALPGPVPVALPEVRLLSKESQYGTAKIGLVAYDAQTNESLGAGGLASARSDDNNWFVLGMGPYQNGTVRQEVASAQQGIAVARPLPRNRVAFSRPNGAVAPGDDLGDILPASRSRVVDEPGF